LFQIEFYDGFNLILLGIMSIVVLILIAALIILLRWIGVLIVLLYVLYVIVRRASRSRWWGDRFKAKSSRLLIPILKQVDINGLNIIDNARLEFIGVGRDLPYVIVRYGFFNIVCIGVLMLQLPRDRLDYVRTLISDMLRMSIRGQIIISTNPESNELKIFNIVKSSRDTLPCGLLKRKAINELVDEAAVKIGITSSYSSSFKILKAPEIPIFFKEVFT
jgi:hypothetical protein